VLANALAPNLMADRAGRYRHQVRIQAGVVDVARKVAEAHGTAVRRGPFASLKYSKSGLKSADAPVAKLLGAYEEELQDYLKLTLDDPPDVFIDLGCAEGYYAVGFALAAHRTLVHAFELSRTLRRDCANLAALNGVSDRLVLHGAASGAALRTLPLAGSLILCDCEGAEVDIFDSEVIGPLSDSRVAIELHEEARPGVQAQLIRRFADTHEARIIEARLPRDTDRYPELHFLSVEEQELALAEFRAAARWGIFTPRSHRSDGGGPTANQ
jgi:hypothetical protein